MNRITLLSLLTLGAFFSSSGFAAEEAVKLQATGTFTINKINNFGDLINCALLYGLDL